MKKTYQIKGTTDYSLFEKSASNRQLKLKKHRKLELSMKKHGFLPWWPIVVFRDDVTNKFTILDGQHRFAIAISLELPIYYVQADHKFDVAEINDTQKTWSVEDYAEVHQSNGLHDYAVGLRFHRENDIPITTAFSLLAGTTSYGNIEQAFKSGNFLVVDKEWADKVAAVYCPISKMSSAVKKVRFLEACAAACRVNEFNPARLIHGANRCRDDLLSYSTRDAYLVMMQKIYNFGRGRRQLFGLEIESRKAMRDRNPIHRSRKTK